MTDRLGVISPNPRHAKQLVVRDKLYVANGFEFCSLGAYWDSRGDFRDAAVNKGLVIDRDASFEGKRADPGDRSTSVFSPRLIPGFSEFEEIRTFLMRLGLLRQEAKCWVEPTDFLDTRSSPCSPIGSGNQSSYRTYVPSAMRKFYSYVITGSTLKIWPLAEFPFGFVRASCVTGSGDRLVAEGPLVKIATNNTIWCIVQGSYHTTQSRRFFFDFHRLWWSGYSSFRYYQCDRIQQPTLLPSIVLAFGRQPDYSYLHSVCRENQNNGAWEGALRRVCVADHRVP